MATPETAPKTGEAFLITTAGPEIDLCKWSDSRQCFIDYYYKQRIGQEWPYMIAWKPKPAPAKIMDTEAETRAANGWKTP